MTYEAWKIRYAILAGEQFIDRLPRSIAAFFVSRSQKSASSKQVNKGEDSEPGQSTNNVQTERRRCECSGAAAAAAKIQEEHDAFGVLAALVVGHDASPLVIGPRGLGGVVSDYTNIPR